jgi:hypothetical protein
MDLQGVLIPTNGVELPISEDTSLLTTPLGEAPSGELGRKGVYSSSSSRGNPCILCEWSEGRCWSHPKKNKTNLWPARETKKLH